MTLRRSLREKRVVRQCQGYSRKMRPTQGVSFPRSGHSAIFNTARRYFGEAFIYCDTNNKRRCGCESVPCINPRRTFAKNHDFGLQNSVGVPIIPSERYLIQYRSPVRSIASNFYLFCNQDRSRRSKSAWQRFALDSINYWNRFVDKWVLDFPPDAGVPLYCSYESLISDPEVNMREVFSYLSDGPLDDEVFNQLFELQPIGHRNRISEFPYYDAGFFREIEELASGRLIRLGLPSFDEEG